MLIICKIKTIFTCIDFNTSHVNVNLYANLCTYQYTRISIHLMLMLILSCVRVLALTSADFNTSHVNVNQIVWISLGTIVHISIHLMLMLIKFTKVKLIIVIHISIHLMLMLIIKIFIHELMCRIHFNTSHVNVNLLSSNLLDGIIYISIHLMLMLINMVAFIID